MAVFCSSKGSCKILKTLHFKDDSVKNNKPTGKNPLSLAEF